jgi:hypothetical protein
VAGNAGFACDSWDDAALASHMERLLDESERARVAARATGAVAALTPAAMTSRLLALYASLGAGT